MVENIIICLPDAKKTTHAGYSLARSLYTLPLDILLNGELGSGKTTFLGGFAEGLGIDEPLTSPTYALEQRYRSHEGTALHHIDLYRLTDTQAAQLLAGTDDHDGIRCIEWAERVADPPDVHPVIRIALAEGDRDGRTLNVQFADARFPSEQEIDEWHAYALLPGHIHKHCRAVADTTQRFAQAVLDRGEIVRPLALKRAADIHDLFRF